MVPDASVILNWVLGGEDEPDQRASDEVRTQWLSEINQIILPSLWRFEVCNVLGTKTPKHAHSIIALLLDYNFEEADIGPDICPLAFDIMTAAKVSFYTAVYHALALACGAVFITADAQYFKKAAAQGSIQMLANMKI